VWPWFVGGAVVLGVIVGGTLYARKASAAQPTTMPSNGNGAAAGQTLANEGELTVENVAATYQIYYDPATGTWWHQWQSTPLSRVQGSGRQSGFQSVAAALADIERQMVQTGMAG
jgi:hypothetical protein